MNGNVTGYEANLLRGQALRYAGRADYAADHLLRAIEADPDRAEAYFELALALGELPRKKSECLGAINRALALNPNSAEYLGAKSYLLAMQEENLEALDFAHRALEIDPECYMALLGLANAHTKLERWERAEEAARLILRKLPFDNSGQNLLAQALRFQGRHEESRRIVATILSHTPEDSFAQANAGYEALKVNRQWQARQHFLNALRLDPASEYARVGLLRSLRERSWFYRMQLKAVLFFGEHWDDSGGMRLLFMFLSVITCGFFVALMFYFLIIAWTFNPIANFLLLADPVGRRVLNKKEHIWAWVTGGLIAALLLGLALADQIDLYKFIGGYLLIFATFVFISNGLDAMLGWREKNLIANIDTRDLP